MNYLKPRATIVISIGINITPCQNSTLPVQAALTEKKMKMEKRTKVDFCGDIVYLTEEEIKIRQKNVDMLRELATKAKIDQDQIH